MSGYNEEQEKIEATMPKGEAPAYGPDMPYSPRRDSSRVEAIAVELTRLPGDLGPLL